MLCETLGFLQAPGTAAKGIALLLAADTQEEQIEYARSLRMLKAGWTTELRTAYFNWFLKAASYRGGRSFSIFIGFIRRDAVASLSDQEKVALKDLLAKKPVVKSPFEIMAEAMIGRKYVKQWKLDRVNAKNDSGRAQYVRIKRWLKVTEENGDALPKSVELRAYLKSEQLKQDRDLMTLCHRVLWPTDGDKAVEKGPVGKDTRKTITAWLQSKSIYVLVKDPTTADLQVLAKDVARYCYLKEGSVGHDESCGGAPAKLRAAVLSALRTTERCSVYVVSSLSSRISTVHREKEDGG